MNEPADIGSVSTSSDTKPGNRLPATRKPAPTKDFLRVGFVALLFSVTALVVTLTFLVAFSGNKQSRAVDSKKFQAVFLQNGQVYFGKIASFNGKTIDLQSIYYLQTNNGETANSQTESSSNNVSLVKLGCELHAPLDRMLINSDQVLFWENIKDDSQVAKAIKQYVEQNKGKINCSASSLNSTQQAPTSSSSSSSDNTGTTNTNGNTQASGTGSTSTNSSSNTSTKKP